MTLYPKELVVATLREFFSKDTYYHYVYDEFGFPKTPDHTDLPIYAGYHDDITTRVYIGESYRFNVDYYPAIIVRHGGSVSVPISINRETAGVQWGDMVYEDGYGNIMTFPTPKSFIFAGAWEGSMNVDIIARDLRARDDLVDLVSLLFVDIAFNDMQRAGLIVKGVSSGAPSETDDRNDHFFRQTVTLQIRSEWRRQIPVGNIIEIINFGIEFPIEPPIAEGLTINTSEDLMNVLEKL